MSVGYHDVVIARLTPLFYLLPRGSIIGPNRINHIECTSYVPSDTAKVESMNRRTSWQPGILAFSGSPDGVLLLYERLVLSLPLTLSEGCLKSDCSLPHPHWRTSREGTQSLSQRFVDFLVESVLVLSRTFVPKLATELDVEEPRSVSIYGKGD